jgi:nucleotide-binding universal stress UspA family protein
MDYIDKFTDAQIHDLHTNAEDMFREVYMTVASLPKEEWPVARIAYLSDLKKRIDAYEEEIRRRKSHAVTSPSPQSEPSIVPNAGLNAKVRAARIFISYAHADEGYKKTLEKHLALLKRLGIVETWSDRDLRPGQEWDEQIRVELDRADIVLLLVSASFLSSNYSYEREVSFALNRQWASVAVVPIILSPVDWKLAPFAKFQALPEDARPISTWENQDEAWAQIASSIRRLVQELGPAR